MTVTALPDYSTVNGCPRVRLTATSTLGGSAWVSLWRVHADGSRYRVIVDRNARLTGGSWTGFDYHAPLNVMVTYEATTASETGVSGLAWVSSDSGWLVHATDPDRSMRIEFLPDDGLGDDEFASKAGVFEIVGSDRPASVWDDSVTISSSARLGFLAEDAGSAQALLRSGGPLLLNLPEAWDVTWRWVQAKSMTLQRNAGVVAFGGKAGYPYRHLSFSYTWVQQPRIDLTPQWSYDDTSTAFVSLNALEAAYATLDNLITDTRV